jgi:predicted RNase H-like HicB family nuclease
MELRMNGMDEKTQVVLDDQHLFRVPIELDAERIEDGSWLVSHPELTVYGVGENLGEATEDFQSMLLDLYAELVASEDVLAPHLKDELEYLRTILVTRATSQ